MDRQELEHEIDNIARNITNLYAGSKFEDARVTVRVEVPCSLREHTAYLAGKHQFDQVTVESYEWQHCKTVHTVKMALIREWAAIPF
jgi:hypothetical protein